MDTELRYRLLTLDDVELAARVITEAFANDPLCTFMLPYPRSRIKTLQKFFRAYGEVNIKSQRGYGLGEPLQGVAYWIFPGQTDVSISIKSLSIFVPLLLTYYPIGYYRARAILNQTDAMHEKYASEPHFYLDNIGVLSAARGRGVASKLIRPFLEMADAQKVITYTDTATSSNVSLYEHFGFQCMEECPIAGTGVTIWALRRPVQA